MVRPNAALRVAAAVAVAGAGAGASASSIAPPQALYGLQTSGAGSPSLVVVNPDGTTAPVGPSLQFIPGVWDVGAVDDTRGTLYVSGVDANDGQRLIGISLQSGLVNSSVAFPWKELGYIGEGIMFAFARDLGLIVTTGEASDGQYVVGTFDPLSGAFRRVTNFTRPAGLRDDIGGSATYCAQSGRFVFDLRGAAEGAHLFSVELATGAMIDAADPDAAVIQSHACSPLDGMVYGMGIRLLPGGGWTRGLYTFDPAKLVVSKVGDTPAWGVDMGAVLAINAAASPPTIWSMMSPSDQYPPNGDTPLQLVGVSLVPAGVNASVVSVGATPLCTAGHNSVCPTTFAWATKR